MKRLAVLELLLAALFSSGSLASGEDLKLSFLTPDSEFKGVEPPGMEISRW